MVLLLTQHFPCGRKCGFFRFSSSERWLYPLDGWILVVLDFSSEPGLATGAKGRNPQALPTPCPKGTCLCTDSCPPTASSPTRAYCQLAKPCRLPSPSPRPLPTPTSNSISRELRRERGARYLGSGLCLCGRGSGILVGLSQQDGGRGRLIWVSNRRSWIP